MSDVIFGLKDLPPSPMLFIDTVDEINLESLCRKFSLNAHAIYNGLLIQPEMPAANYKMNYFDLIFFAIACIKKNKNLKFLLFEKNNLKEELEVNIIGQANPETKVEYQIQNWRSSKQSFTLSGMAQSALFQIGILNEWRQESTDIELTKLINQIEKSNSITLRKAA